MADDCAPAPRSPVSNKSGRTVKCVKFGKELPGLDVQPWPGELGKRSSRASRAGVEDVGRAAEDDPQRIPPDAVAEEAQQLVAQMEDFFFGEGAALPPGYVPQQSK